MSTADTEFFRAFAGRVRNTVATTPEGSPTMSDTTTETVEVPATFQADPDTPCSVPWCGETGAHVEHVGRAVTLPEVSAQIWQDTVDAQPTIVVGNPQDDYQSFTSGDQLRERAAQIRGGSVRLEALADEYDALREAAGTATPQPDLTAENAPAARRWTITTELGVEVSGYLPAWADRDPSVKNVPANQLQMHLSDLTLVRNYPGQSMTVDAPFAAGGKHEVYEENGVFRTQIWCSPHDADRPDYREPYAFITILEDCVMDNLGPAELAGVAAQLRAQAARIEQASVDLAAAREDWAKNGGTR